MSVANTVIGLLGLAPQFQQAATMIEASKTAIEAVNALNELLKSEDGEKFKKHMVELIGGSKEEDGVVKLDTTPVPEVAQVDMCWAWKDGLTGYAWVHRAEALANGWPIYGEG